MDMIARYFTRYNVNLMFKSNLAQDVARSYRYSTGQYALPIFGKPDQVDFKVRFGMCTQLITSHSDIYKLFFA
ncbi:MAG: hypothetical protein WA133_08135 [Syntrophales bacterium]